MLIKLKHLLFGSSIRGDRWIGGWARVWLLEQRQTDRRSTIDTFWGWVAIGRLRRNKKEHPSDIQNKVSA